LNQYINKLIVKSGKIGINNNLKIMKRNFDLDDLEIENYRLTILKPWKFRKNNILSNNSPE